VRTSAYRHRIPKTGEAVLGGAVHQLYGRFRSGECWLPKRNADPNIAVENPSWAQFSGLLTTTMISEMHIGLSPEVRGGSSNRGGPKTNKGSGHPTAAISARARQYGTALPWHGRGHRFEPDQVHQIPQTLTPTPPRNPSCMESKWSPYWLVPWAVMGTVSLILAARD
jgi:hypothetical protein